MRRFRWGLLLLLAAVAVGSVGVSSGWADEEHPPADVMVTQTANVAHAKIGDTVEFSIVAHNNGPASPDLFDLFFEPQLVEANFPSVWANISSGTIPPSGFEITSATCTYTFSETFTEPAVLTNPLVGLWCQPSADGAPPTWFATVDAVVKPTADKFVSYTSCVYGDQWPDPNLSNNCATTTIRVIGKRGG